MKTYLENRDDVIDILAELRVDELSEESLKNFAYEYFYQNLCKLSDDDLIKAAESNKVKTETYIDTGE